VQVEPALNQLSGSVDTIKASDCKAKVREQPPEPAPSPRPATRAIPAARLPVLLARPALLSRLRVALRVRRKQCIAEAEHEA
jgi:hypothetical protein